MTRRAALFIGAGGLLLCLGLALGNLLYFFLAYSLFLITLYAFLSALFAFLSCRYNFRLIGDSVQRGETLRLAISAYQRFPLPVAPIEVSYRFGETKAQKNFSSAFFRREDTVVTMPARHVGTYPAGISAVRVSDCFGLFVFQKRVAEADNALVLPRPFSIDKPRFFAGDEGSTALQRTLEDFSSPEDVRPFVPGDALKRVHWKLSVRRRALLVRKYETPAPPDTLILLDCSEPEDVKDAERRAALRDVLCETAVAVAKMQMADQSPVRLPLYGERANEFSSDDESALPLMQEMLALQTFRRGEDFARVLLLELRRMRRTGATVVITTRLDALIAENVISIRRMGPSARLYLVTWTPEDEKYKPFVRRLQHHLVEVCYVTPQ